MAENKKDKTTLITFLSISALFLMLFMWMILPYTLAVVMGGVLAVLLTPLYEKLLKKKIKPKYASFIITLLLTVLILGPLTGLTILAVKQGVTVGESLAESEEFSYDAISEKAVNLPMIDAIIGDQAAVEKTLKSSFKNAGKTLSGGILALITKAPELTLQLVLALIALFFFLIDGRKFVAWIFEKIPMDQDVEVKLIESFNNISVSVVFATLAAAGAQATMMLIAFLVLQVPGAFFAAGVTFVLAWIPMVGSTPVWVAGMIYLYYKGSITKVIIMLVLGFLTTLVDNFVRPLVLQGRGNIHPLLSLVAIFGGIVMFGIVGVFIGPIIAAVLVQLFEIWPVVAHRFGLMRDNGVK
ncbi:MAG: AI-2E family transporter [Oligoflexia bacterium]|nr:AI-2E family transporter [Oligoflexia bacterium]